MTPTYLTALFGLLLLFPYREATPTQNGGVDKTPSQTEASNFTKHEVKNVLSFEDATVIDLDEIHKMSVLEYLARQTRSMWNDLINGQTQPESTFVGRCMRIAKKIGQLIPIVMIGGGILITKLAFLVLFSLKTIGMLGLLLLLNVATTAGKLGAYLANKKDDHSPQNLHVHVQPWKSHEHSISSSVHHGSHPPYGWDDKSDVNVETHELYNLYEKLKLENDLRKYLSTRHSQLP